MAEIVATLRVSAIGLERATIDDAGRVTFEDPALAEGLRKIKAGLQQRESGGGGGGGGFFDTNCSCTKP